MKSNAEIQKKLNKLLLLTDMFIQEIEDEELEMNEKTSLLHDKLKEVNVLLLPLLDNFYKNEGVSQTNFYQELQSKFNYNFNREYKRYFKF